VFSEFRGENLVVEFVSLTKSTRKLIMGINIETVIQERDNTQRWIKTTLVKKCISKNSFKKF